MGNVGMFRNGRRVQHGFAYSTNLERMDGADVMGSAVDARVTTRPRTARKRNRTDWMMNVTGNVEKFEFTTSAKQRLRGMLFRDPDNVTRILVPCHDVHTLGMQHPLDIAFISKDGEVLEVYRDVGARRRLKNSHAAMVAERFSRQDEWLCAGDSIRLGVLKEGDENAGS